MDGVVGDEKAAKHGGCGAEAEEKECLNDKKCNKSVGASHYKIVYKPTTDHHHHRPTLIRASSRSSS